jgi:hypothetical protein
MGGWVSNCFFGLASLIAMSSLGHTLLGWFKSRGGVVDEEHMRIGEIEGCGFAALAVKDISVRLSPHAFYLVLILNRKAMSCSKSLETSYYPLGHVHSSLILRLKSGKDWAKAGHPLFYV